MCAAWKKKNVRNEIVFFYCHQFDIFLCGIARFSLGNKNELRTFQPQKWKNIISSQPQTKFTGSYKKRECFEDYLWLPASKLYLKRDCNTVVFLWTLLFKNTYFLVDLRMTGSKTPIRESLFNKVASVTTWKHLTVLEREPSKGIYLFICEFCEILRKIFCRTPASNHFSQMLFFSFL